MIGEYGELSSVEKHYAAFYQSQNKSGYPVKWLTYL